MRWSNRYHFGFLLRKVYKSKCFMFHEKIKSGFFSTSFWERKKIKIRTSTPKTQRLHVKPLNEQCFNYARLFSSFERRRLGKYGLICLYSRAKTSHPANQPANQPTRMKKIQILIIWYIVYLISDEDLWLMILCYLLTHSTLLLLGPISTTILLIRFKKKIPDLLNVSWMNNDDRLS